MKLQALESFEILNKETVNIITGGNAALAYDCSKKGDVDSTSGDFIQEV